MPLYESRKHAENIVKVEPEWRNALVIGPRAVIARVIACIQDGASTVAFDGWYDIDWPAIRVELDNQAGRAGPPNSPKRIVIRAILQKVVDTATHVRAHTT